MRPTGSSENQSSITTGPVCGCGAPWGSRIGPPGTPPGPKLPEPGGGWNCKSGWMPPALPPIMSAETHPEFWRSDSIFFRRISSTMSDIRTQSIPMGRRWSPVLSYTVISISFALSMLKSWTSSIHLSVLVGLVRPLMASSTLMLTNVSGPRLKRPVAA
jgi:hypothetical protein